MNKQLYQAYKELNDMQQAKLRHKYKDSPVGLRLIEFLTGTNNANFKTSEAVEFIYKGNEEGDYSVLENRYFKLRKKIYDELQSKPSDDEDKELAEEEAILNRCKHLITMGENKEAYKQLAVLEKQCMDRNIFELLPSVIDNMIFCNQGMQDTEKNRELLKEMAKAIELQYDFNRAVMLIREIYELTLTKGFRYVKAQLAALKELSLKNKDYPRFSMCYHHISASHKLSSMEYAENMQVISRHLAEFKKLYAANPMMPLVIYKANYEKLLHFHTNQLNVLFHTNKGEFEEAYQSLKEMWEMVQRSAIFKRYNVDALYFNLFSLQLLTSRYAQAYETSRLLGENIKENKRTDKMLLVNMMKSMLYVNSYPQTFKMDIGYLIEQTDEYMKEVKKHSNVQIPHDQALVVKAKLYIIKGDVSKAKKLLQTDEAVKYLEQANVLDLARLVIDVLDNKTDRNKPEQVIKMATQRRFKAVRLDEFIEDNWFINYANYLLLHR